MTSISNFNGAEKVNLFLGAVIGFFVVYFFFSSNHMDRASQTKGFIFQIAGAVIGFGIAYFWINSKHQS